MTKKSGMTAGVAAIVGSPTARRKHGRHRAPWHRDRHDGLLAGAQTALQSMPDMARRVADALPVPRHKKRQTIVQRIPSIIEGVGTLVGTAAVAAQVVSTLKGTKEEGGDGAPHTNGHAPRTTGANGSSTRRPPARTPGRSASRSQPSRPKPSRAPSTAAATKSPAKTPAKPAPTRGSKPAARTPAKTGSRPAAKRTSDHTASTARTRASRTTGRKA